jgi:hypothetical protein
MAADLQSHYQYWKTFDILNLQVIVSFCRGWLRGQENNLISILLIFVLPAMIYEAETSA